MSAGLTFKMATSTKNDPCWTEISSLRNPPAYQTSVISFLPGFGECKAAKRLEVLQRKLISEQNLGRKQMNIQQDSFPLKNENVTEACSGGMSLCSACIV
jgi:hypothetical protein